MWSRLSRATPLVFALLAVTFLAAGCIAPDDGGVCYGPQGEVWYVVTTQDGAERGVPATDPTRWSLRVSCSQERQAIEDLSIRVETVAHGTLVAEGDQPLPNDGVLTLYALAAREDPDATWTFTPDLPPPGSGPAYRLRITDDSRSREGLDLRDLFELRFDADGRRDFQSELPIGTYWLRIHDRADDKHLGAVSHRFFDPRIERGEDTSGGL